MTLLLSPIQPDPPPTAALRREALGYLGMILARTSYQTAESLAATLAEAAIERFADLARRLDTAAEALPTDTKNRARFAARAAQIAGSLRAWDAEGAPE